MSRATMARRAPAPEALGVLLSAIPSLPRPVLARLTFRLIERLDELDGDSDLEPETDEGESDTEDDREGDV